MKAQLKPYTSKQDKVFTVVAIPHTYNTRYKVYENGKYLFWCNVGDLRFIKL